MCSICTCFVLHGLKEISCIFYIYIYIYIFLCYTLIFKWYLFQRLPIGSARREPVAYCSPENRSPVEHWGTPFCLWAKMHPKPRPTSIPLPARWRSNAETLWRRRPKQQHRELRRIRNSRPQRRRITRCRFIAHGAGEGFPSTTSLVIWRFIFIFLFLPWGIASSLAARELACFG